MANKKLIYSFDFKKLLNEKIKQYPQGSTQRNMIYAVLQWLDKVPRIDAAPVRHGKWKSDVWRFECSICNTWFNLDDCYSGEATAGMNYCPNCGAKMDEEVVDNGCISKD